MANSEYQFSVVVPVYNSEGSLALLHKRLTDVFQSLKASWELILVNDCSRDKSWEVMRELAEKDARVTAIHLTNNFGQHNALICGFNYAQGNYVITMDDDLQHPPEEIPKLVEKIEGGELSVVYGQYISKKHGLLRDLASNWVNVILARITGSGYKVTSFRIMRGEVARTLTSFKQYSVMVDVLIKDIVSRREVGHVSVEHHAREIGRSNYSYKKLIAYALNMIFSYTLWPLRFATFVGLVLALLGILVGAYFFVDYFIHRVPVQGFTTIIVALTILSGTILFVLGIIGEYVGRIFLSTNQKPQYFVKEVYTHHKST